MSSGRLLQPWSSSREWADTDSDKLLPLQEFVSNCSHKEVKVVWTHNAKKVDAASKNYHSRHNARKKKWKIQDIFKWEHNNMNQAWDRTMVSESMWHPIPWELCWQRSQLVFCVVWDNIWFSRKSMPVKQKLSCVAIPRQSVFNGSLYLSGSSSDGVVSTYIVDSITQDGWTVLTRQQFSSRDNVQPTTVHKYLTANIRNT